MVTVAERFGANLRRCRRRAGLSQEQAAVRASLHRSAIGLLERGERVARVDTLVKLMGALEADPDELLAGLEWLPGQVHSGRFSTPDQGATL
jgi:transcriptional regulator with XRE-family HTH domain